MKKRNLKFFRNLGKRIKEEREKNNYTIEDLSKLTGIRKQYIEKIENGIAFGLTTGKFFKITEGLNIKPHDLAKGL